MTGLLDWIKTPEGQGLLGAVAGYAANAQRGAPINSLGRGGLAGLLAYGHATGRQDELAQRAKQDEVRTLQMEQMRLQTDAARRAAGQEQAIQTAAQQSFRTPEQAAAMSVGPTQDGGVVSFQPGFDTSMFLQRLQGIDPLKAVEFEQKLRKDSAPIKLTAGDTLLDPKTLKPVFTAPKEQELPSAVREYEFAKSQGFGGTFEQWQLQQKKAGATNVNVSTGQKGLENELKIRSDFRSEPIYKAHNEVESAYRQITSSLKMASPAGDLAGATKIMKILDPGSVVRESELGMAMAATGALDRLTNYADMVIKGTKLTPEQRKDFQALADKLYAESATAYNAKRGEYAGFAKDYGLDEGRILGPQIKPPKQTQTAGRQAFDQMPPANGANKGRFLTDQTTGKRFQSNGMQWVEVK